MNEKIPSISVIIFSLFSSTCFANEATQQCADVYRDNMSQINTASQTAYAISEIYKNECNSDGTALNVGYSDKSSSLLGSLSDKARDFFAAYKKTSDFCSAYKRNEFNYYTSTSFEKKPLVDLATQFNSCMRIASDYNYAVWSSTNGPAEVVFHGQFFSSKGTSITFNTSATYDGAECFSPENNREVRFGRGTQKQLTNEFTLTCRRKGKEEKDSIVYRAANVLISFNGQPYPITMPADRVYYQPGNAPKSAQEALNMAAELQAQIAVEKQNTASLESELSILKQKKYFPRVVYVGEHNMGMPGVRILTNIPKDPDGSIIHFGCGMKDSSGRPRLDPTNNNDRSILGDKLKVSVCGEKAGSWNYMGHAEGNNCGYDSYIISCEM